MSKIINIVDSNDKLVASITNDNVILHKDYRVVETNENEACYFDSDGTIELIKPEISS